MPMTGFVSPKIALKLRKVISSSPQSRCNALARFGIAGGVNHAMGL
jgi:hypothetical protein